MKHHAIFGSILLAGALSIPAQAAEDCGPLKQIASLDMEMDGGRYLVPVTMNGVPQKMLLNTGGSIITMRQDAVDALGLHAIDASHIRLLSNNGTVSQSFVQVDFKIGSIRAPNLQMIVMPAAEGGTPPFAGGLAGDFLSLYDVEMDFANRKLNFFSKDHCPGKVIYWKTDAYAMLPVTLQLPTGDNSRTGFRAFSYRGSHINVPVAINGKNLDAAIDTASQTSAMSSDTAQYLFGVTAGSPGATPVESSDPNPEHRLFRYTFPTLTFDTVTVTNARFLIYPNLTGSKDPNNSSRTDTRVRHIDDNIGGGTTIGLDVLRRLHLYVAYGERKLYITPASAPQATAAAQ